MLPITVEHNRNTKEICYALEKKDRPSDEKKLFPLGHSSGCGGGGEFSHRKEFLFKGRPPTGERSFRKNFIAVVFNQQTASFGARSTKLPVDIQKTVLGSSSNDFY
jgi:hypothetical protein